jgi:hypothetical protein
MANEHQWFWPSEDDPNFGYDVESHAFTLSGKVLSEEEAEQYSQQLFEARQAGKRTEDSHDH